MTTAQKINKLTNQIAQEERAISPNLKKIKKWEKQMHNAFKMVQNSPKLQKQYEKENCCKWEGYED